MNKTLTKMMMENNYTNNLIQVIIGNIGVPIPKYDYVKRKFTIEVPINISTGSGEVGAFAKDEFETFNDACEAIIKWDLDLNNSADETNKD